MSVSNEIYQMTTIGMGDALTEESSQDGSVFDDTDLMSSSSNADVVAVQLANAGPIGVAAAAAISSSGKKHRRLHSFETNPSIRKRQQTRLQRKLNALMEEYIARVGQQAAIVYCTPGKSQHQPHYYKVVGSQPLENIMKVHKTSIMADLEEILTAQAPTATDTSDMFELPPLTVDGIPTQLDKMTQAQLRNFIPEMLRYSTGKSKPGWGKPECQPIWWPTDVPWCNIRSDSRDEEAKKAVSWTHALRTIVLNCYRHHGREDLLPSFPTMDTKALLFQLGSDNGQTTLIQAINNPDGTTAYIAIDTGDSNQGDIVTLADGTQARVLHAIPSSQSQGSTLSFLQGSQTSLGSLITEDGQLLLTGNNGPLNMYSIYQPVLSDLGGVSATSAGDGYHVLAAASEGHVMLTEITTKMEKCSDEEDDVTVGHATDLTDNLDMICDSVPT